MRLSKYEQQLLDERRATIRAKRAKAGEAK